MNFILRAQKQGKKLFDTRLCILASLLVKKRIFSDYLPVRIIKLQSQKMSTAKEKSLHIAFFVVLEVSFMVPIIYYLLILQVLHYI